MNDAPQTPALPPADTPAAPSPEGRPAAKVRRPRPIKRGVFRGGARRTGAQAALSRVSGLSRSQISDLICGRAGLSAPRARQFGRILGGDAVLWIAQGGTPAQRRAAVEAWFQNFRREEINGAVTPRPRPGETNAAVAAPLSPQTNVAVATGAPGLD